MKILLICNGGMSSSMLMSKMKDAAVRSGKEVMIEAVPNTGLEDQAGRFDVCLVGPQIIYAIESIRQTLGIPVASVETRTYAMADGERALEQAEKLLAENNHG